VAQSSKLVEWNYPKEIPSGQNDERIATQQTMNRIPKAGIQKILKQIKN
jgi:hypothetical protein